MLDLLIEVKGKVDKAKAKAKGKTINKKLMIYYEKRYKRIIYEGKRENPAVSLIACDQKKRGRKKKGKVLCLLDRFKTRFLQVFAFMYDILVPFDNNQALSSGFNYPQDFFKSLIEGKNIQIVA